VEFQIVQVYICSAKNIHYLGHLISNDDIATNPAKVQAISTWPNLTDIK